jgi:hypothetical protein
VLGLCATAEVPVDKGDRLLVPAAPLQEGESVLDRHAIGVRDHDELVRLVAGLLREKYDEEPTRDDEGDFVLEHLGQHVYVRAREDQPVVQIFARVAHDVASRRSAAVEIALLNRDHTWSKWNLIGRGLFQTLALPATPFVPAHVWAMIDLFLGSMAETRDDLVLRTRAKVA